ncbi:hypothetical protein [Streptomyces sp. Wh19]|uniref:hypothetical protein n=1 Tax=Streptomyces sp. Wh19 TaxID=3076629 RepID=UPI002958A425|nr:hypothetical protein [Streptomyces sp. Wh19]MDV9194583.1 hypothetical protein [Streptomyces sp. Wh19]
MEVGQYHQPDGPLTLVDERVRAEALDALRAHGLDVDTSEVLVTLSGFPSAVVAAGGDRWSLRLSKPGVSRGGLPEAGWFDPDSSTLTVYAASLAEPFTVLLRRHGVRPLLVTLDTPREDVERHNRRAAVAPAGISPVGRFSRVSAAAQRLVPEPHRRWLGAKPDGGEALAAKAGSLLRPRFHTAPGTASRYWT